MSMYDIRNIKVKKVISINKTLLKEYPIMKDTDFNAPCTGGYKFYIAQGQKGTFHLYQDMYEADGSISISNDFLFEGIEDLTIYYQELCKEIDERRKCRTLDWSSHKNDKQELVALVS